jgi:hypothetical protein
VIIVASCNRGLASLNDATPADEAMASPKL